MVTSLVTVLGIVLSVCIRGFDGAVVYNDETLTKGSKCRLNDGAEGECGTHCVENSLIHARSDICGFDRDEVILCCKNEVKLRFSQYPTIETVCQNRLIVHNWSKHQEPVLDTGTGKSYASPAVAAIFRAFPNEHPHMAVLGWTLQEKTIDWECGGSLIHPLYVLTAAHCIYYREFPPDHVRIGGIDLFNDFLNRFVIDYDIKRTYVHPDYSYTQNYNDIALLLVSKTPEHKHYPDPQPACIWTKKEVPQEKLLIMGYGAPSFGMTNNYALYQGNLTVLEFENCNKHYERSDHLPRGLIDSQFCAFDPERKLDTCHGHSGGPIQFNDKSTGVPYIVGVTSFGAICLSDTPGVYTRIYSYLDWIEDQISKKVEV